jgi:uncharacterized membrane protein
MARIASIDALRGVAIIAMIVYHLCFDLRHFGLVGGISSTTRRGSPHAR